MPNNLHNIIFPELSSQTWKEVNLNNYVSFFNYDDLKRITNPLLYPQKQSVFVDDVHRAEICDYSYGGYLEDRSFIWRDSYLDTKKMIHLGIDYNVPAGTLVRTPFPGEIVFAKHDEDQNGGWGGRIDFYNKKGEFYFILGHLNEAVKTCRPNECFNSRTIIGFVGDSGCNGGWYPHLHLQVVSKKEYESCDPMKIDGYGGNKKSKKALPLEKRFPNPETIEEY